MQANLSLEEGQMNRETLATQLADLLPEKLTARTLELPAVPGRADVVTGMRRSGKTRFLYQLLREHLDKGTGWNRLLLRTCPLFSRGLLQSS